MLFILLGPIVILVLTLAVPFVYRFVWPGAATRPNLFFGVSLALALIIAAIAIIWFAQALVGIGLARPSPATASARSEALLRIRLLVALIFSVAAQYIGCYTIQNLLRR